jgi:hypothetical protein
MTISAGILTETITSTDSYLYVVSGSCLVNGILLQEGDGAELNNDTILPADCPHLVLFENHSI